MNSLDSILDQVKPFLIAYLEEHKISPNEKGFVNCLNPDHDDNNPSMHLVPTANDQVLYCFSCHACYNIFHVAHVLDTYPLRGKEFIYENVLQLADKFGVPYDKEKLSPTEEEIEVMRYRKLYNDAALVLSEEGDRTHCRGRSWSEGFCKEHGVGSLDWDKFVTSLCHKGLYKREEIEAKGIRYELFNGNLITFPVRDSKGQVCGFAARNVLYKDEDKTTHPKYRNTSDFVPIYNKSELFFGMHVASHHPEKRLDIFEGYADWMTMQDAGHRHCVALGGTALTHEHIKIIRDIGFTHINLVLDADSTGIQKMRNYLDRYCSGIPGLKVTVIILPFDDSVEKEGRDPDSFVQNMGLAEYLQLTPMSSFDWRLRDLLIKKEDKNSIARQMIHYILNEESPIERGHMSAALARATGIREDDIRAEVSRKINTQVKQISEVTQNRLKRAKDSVEVQDIITKAAERIKSTTDTKDFKSYESVEVIDHLSRFIDEAQKPHEGLAGWKTGMMSFDDPCVLDGIPKKDSIITFAGAPNHGKSAIMNNLVTGLINPKNDNDNLSVLLWSLDDSRNVTWAKLLASLSNIPIKDIRYPHRRIMKDETLKKRYLGWCGFLKEIVRQERLIVKGYDIGNNLSACEYWIKHVQDKTGKDVVLFIDAVHDMTTGNSDWDGQERIKFIRCSTGSRNLPKKWHILS